MQGEERRRVGLALLALIAYVPPRSRTGEGFIPAKNQSDDDDNRVSAGVLGCAKAGPACV